MSAAENSPSASDTPPAKTGTSSSDKLVIAAVALCLAGLGAYQLFFCPTCYELADRTAVHDTAEPSP